MNILKKLWKFLLFILPMTRSTLKDAKEILTYVDGGLELLEKQSSWNLTNHRAALEQLKKEL